MDHESVLRLSNEEPPIPSNVAASVTLHVYHLVILVKDPIVQAKPFLKPFLPISPLGFEAGTKSRCSLSLTDETL